MGVMGKKFTSTLFHSLMKETVKEALKSKSEDGRVHPKVGAILVNPKGKILHRAHRGEKKGSHAEYVLLEKARQAGTNLKKAILFASLEPCTQRSPEKIPCVKRVIESGIPTIYIGTLDPNPNINGKGETYLIYEGRVVERFTYEYQTQLWNINREFFEQHRHAHQTFNSLYIPSKTAQDYYQPKLVNSRDGLLHQSMDLIFGSSEEIWIMAGDLSWLRELQPCLFYAALQKREIKIICTPKSKNIYEERKETARFLGASVAIVKGTFPLRGTIVEPYTSRASMISIETMPHLHGSLFRKPQDSSVLDAMVKLFGDTWKNAKKERKKYLSMFQYLIKS